LASVTEKKILAKERFDLVKKALDNADIDKDTRNRVEAKTKKAQEAYDTAVIALNSADYVTARTEFIESMTLMQEAKIIASVPKFLGFEDMVSTSNSTSTSSVSEFDIKDIKTKEDKIDTSAEDASNKKKVEVHVEATSIQETNHNDSSAESKKDEKSENVVEKTETKVKEIHKDVESSVNDLLP
jgi:hypothetical protein